MEQILGFPRLAVTVTCLVCLGLSVGMCSESDPLIKTVVSSSLPSNNGDLFYSAKLNTVQNITQSDWDAIMWSSELSLLVMFTAEECKECRKMDRLLDDLADRYTGRYRFYKINLDEAPVLAQNYEVTEVPTTIFFRHRLAMEEVIGFMPERVTELVDLYAH